MSRRVYHEQIRDVLRNDFMWNIIYRQELSSMGVKGITYIKANM